MAALTDIFIKRPVLSVVVSLLILLIGFRAATSLPIRQYPKLSNTVVNVTTSYPGASAALIQGFITTPIEQAVASAEGVDYITSSSVQGTSPRKVRHLVTAGKSGRDRAPFYRPAVSAASLLLPRPAPRSPWP